MSSAFSYFGGLTCPTKAFLNGFWKEGEQNSIALKIQLTN